MKGTTSRQVPAGLLALGLGGAGALVVQYTSVTRAVVGLVALTIFAAIAATDRKAALTFAVVWLALLGFTRRFLIPFVGWNEYDPLLLVSPVCAIILWHYGSRERKAPLTALAALAAVLFVFTIAQIFNPAEPDLFLGVVGSLWWLTPLLWFFAGRSLSTSEHEHVMKVVLGVGVAVVAHGLYHTFVGLLPFEYTWLDFSGPGESIFFPGFRVRPFSTLVSPQEYGYFLAFLLAIVWGILLHRRIGRGWLGAYFAIATVALFLQGTRTIFVFFLVMLVVTTILRLRSPGASFVLAGSFVFLIVFVVGMMQPVQQLPSEGPEVEDRSLASMITTHQLHGFTAPEETTAPLHYELVTDAFRLSLAHPLGLGLGQASLAAHQAGRDLLAPERDVPFVFGAFGPVGGVIYVLFIVAGLIAAVRAYRHDPTWLHLAWVGILVAGLTNWWAGTLYATSTILFLALGGLSADRWRAIRTPDRWPPEHAGSALESPGIPGRPDA